MVFSLVVASIVPMRDAYPPHNSDYTRICAFYRIGKNFLFCKIFIARKREILRECGPDSYQPESASG